jgi:hypothetical protein
MALAQRHEVGPGQSPWIILVLEWLDVVDFLCWLMLTLLFTPHTPRVMLQEQASES